ncbi:cortical protein marker for cell polarity-domain-containing protein [Microdochium trichocladiopsis]|uniref:Cortical protein marker for cell polarity-domain-containing protein n=1 Tax=Microdochium trichocladiopsis TaxID=1682393 RepID=A0A9P8YDN6_9PEZI|nr:cortical protein marker for cell polarity-domain-containing protein [Microdochium trichocladiopsis]KAH7034992.1 cortical protein marker for cell polarity-domain-containing protein [Microdochium trichocladiopsis]
MLSAIVSATHGSLFSPNPIPTPALDTAELGRMGIAGDFAGLSLYQFEGQTETLPSSNGADALLTSLPNGLFHSIASTDATVQAMCIFGTSAIIGGNFTSVNGTESPAVAALDLTTGSLSPLAGISGEITSLLCDNDAGMVYVGGSFRAADSTNAITWVSSGNWASLPFAGFNGPVSSITKAPNGHIVFGGKFTGLGNTSTTATPDSEPINLSTAVVQGFQSSTAPGLSNASNVICNTNDETGAGRSWLLLDNTPGAWRAEFGFGFIPTKLRLRNTRQPDRGTKTWRMTALPLNGIMNFTYIDPASGQNTSCTSECPLSNDPKVEYQDFFFVNPVRMNALRLDILEWFGKGAGLDGVQVFQDALVAHAVNDFNTPACSNTTAPARATATGPWRVTASGQSNSKYLSADITPSQASGLPEVVFFPPVSESGSYDVVMYTPGCIVDGTCLSRGQVEVITRLKENEDPTTITLFQTNDFDKYDQIAAGPADPVSGSFRPSVTLRPVPNQSLQQGANSQVVVAQAIAFWLNNSTSSGLNGLFEYDPAQATINDQDVQSSQFVKLSTTFARNSAVSALTTTGDVTYIGGNFSSNGDSHLAAISSNAQNPVSVGGGGLNNAVTSLFLAEDGKLYAGGAFTGTEDGSTNNLNRIAVYDTTAKSWSPLGGGVDGLVKKIVPMVFNMSGISEDVITLSGDFQKLLAFGNNGETQVDGFAVWVKSQNNWLQNAQGAAPLLRGTLSASLLGLENGINLYAGSLSAQALRANGIASFTSSISSFPVNILPNSTASSNSRLQRASVLESVNNTYGVMAGTFYKTDQGSNLTILGGHFTAKATDGSNVQNLVIVDGADDDAVTGLPQGISSDSTFLALATQGDFLFAGGKMNGTIGGSIVTGVLSYNLPSKSFGRQPPALSGGGVTVSSILVRPDTTDVFVGGAFASAGSLPCPAVCVFSTSTNQWSRPGFSLAGETRSMIWSSNTVLVAGGQFTINGTTQYLASFDASSSTWSTYPGSADIPGPVDAITIATGDGNQLWIAGAESETRSFLMKFDGQAWTKAPVSFEDNTVIRSMQMYRLSSDHDDTTSIPANQVLMLTGSIGIPGFGTASVALFDGTSLKPFILSTNADGKAGHVSKLFVENPSKFFTSSESGMPLGFIVLIALAISLGLMLIIVVAGLALDRYRKKREGYIPAPTSMLDRGNGMQRIPPHELLDSLNKGRPGAPHV